MADKIDKYDLLMIKYLKGLFSDIEMVSYDIPGVEVKEYKYLDDDNSFHTLNVYKPIGLTDKAPLIIDVHGGAWMDGDKDTKKSIDSLFASKGYIVISMGYRLLPEAHLYEMVYDVHKAIEYILKMDSDYDRNNIFIMGDSAGGHLLMLDKAINDSDELLKIFGFNHNEVIYNGIILNHPAPDTDHPKRKLFETKLTGNLFRRLLYGKDYQDEPYYNYYSLDNFMPYFHNDSDVLMITSEGDDVAGPQIKLIIENFDMFGINCELYKGGNYPHVYNTLDIGTDEARDCNNKILEFIRNHIKED